MRHHDPETPPPSKLSPQRRRAAPLAPAQTRRPAGRRLAKGAAPSIRPRAGVRPREPRRRSGLFRVLGLQPRKPSPLPGRHPRRTGRRQPLLVSRLRDQRSRHLQAHRIHAGADQRPTGGKTALAHGFQGSFSELFSTTPASGASACVWAAIFPPSCRPTRAACSTPPAAGNCRRSTLPICPRSSTRSRRRPRPALRLTTRCPTSPKSATAKLRRQTLAAAYPLGADSPN
jgi:hypothetical protein